LAGVLRLTLPAGWRSRPSEAPVAFERENEESRIPFTIEPAGPVEQGQHTLEAEVAAGGQRWQSSFDEITQPGLESVILSRRAIHRVRTVDVRIASALRTAYITGTGDEVPAALVQLGAAVEFLDAAALATGDLSKYHTILLGIRAYAARQDVKTYNARLLEYVRNGGVLVVQYNTQEYDNNYGPHPYTMTARAEEVSEEDSPVEILAPEDPVFRWPNRITARDFEGWVEQRGSKFWMTWDPAYKPLLATHDTGQQPQTGGWLVARYGKGLYIYCAYSWYRQLPYAVPGAARIFANLVSLGSPESPWRAEVR